MQLRYRSRTALIMPMVLLAVVVVEEVAVYKLRQHLIDPHLRTAAVLLFFGVAFVFVTSVLGPRLARLLISARKGSKREAGAVGLWLFYAMGYGLLYYAFFVLETLGPAGLLPAAWR